MTKVLYLNLDFVVHEKVKAKSSDFNKFKVKKSSNCKAFRVGEMSFRVGEDVIRRVNTERSQVRLWI